MKHQILSRGLSMTAAAALSCTAVLGSGGLQCAAAKLPETAVQQAEQQTNDGEPVSVIVKVAGDAVLAQPDAAGMGSEYLDSEAGRQRTAQCKAVQQAVQDRIRRLWPELSVKFSYTALFNGFSCELPADLIEQVRALPDVVSVTQANAVQVPQMDRAAALSGFPAYYDMTGCSGEGQVIAVIDSELDTSHPMFAPLANDIQTALSYEDVAEVINSGVLNIDVAPDRAYLSSKLPYVIDYVNDPYDGVQDYYSYHGTHVSGIAAGNAFTASDGTQLCGIAKDAQIIFCACGEGYYVYLDAALAGFEDAVKLHADVITMSWGAEDEYYGESPYTDLMAAADNAGISLFNAAGNSGNGSRKGNVITPESPDSGRMVDKAELGSPVMMVASADNTAQSEAGMFIFDGDQIVYRPTMDVYGMIRFLSQELAPGDYEYVWCGNGISIENFLPEEVEGRLALVQCTSFNDADSIAYKAEEAGAIGVILIDKEFPDGADYVSCYEPINCALITYADGQRMIAAENKTVTFTGENVLRDYPTQVSYYSSWGVKHSLDLRPDIMGIGGRVKSADYGNSYETASGTSMATPYVAGCAAVIRQYLMQQGIDLTGSDLTAYIRKLMMNTAIPYEEDGLPVTPRRQGAGLVSLDRAVSAKVLMNGPSGDAKVNLFDNLGSSFSFDVTLINNSSEDVTFAESVLRLTTDNSFYEQELCYESLRGQQALNCTTNISGPVTLAAGQSETVTVQVSLDAAQYAQLHEKFRYGFFIEGYLMLSGAENSADISIPLLGFSDDWAQLPVAAPDKVMAIADDVTSGVPVVEYYGIIKDLASRAPEYIPEDQMFNLWECATEEERQLLQFGRNEAWISPNGDGLMDTLTGMALALNRRFARADMELTDAEGNVFWEKNDFTLDFYSTRIDDREQFDQTMLEEGTYTLTLKAHIDYPGSAENPQIYTSKVIVDKTAPEVTGEYIERDGRTILSLTASDDRQLQGIAVFGNGTGGTADTYDPETYNKDWWGYNWEYCGFGYNANGTIQDMSWVYQFQDFPSLWHSGGLSETYAEPTWDFLDFAPFQENPDGTFTLEYDITDLTEYTLLVLDNAYNAVEFHKETTGAEDLLQEKGFWEDKKHGIYEIADDCIRFKDYYTGELTEYSVTAAGEQLTLTSENDTRSLQVRKYSDGIYRMTDHETGEDMQIFFLKFIDDFKDMPFRPINEIREFCIADTLAMHGKEIKETIFDFTNPSISIRLILDKEADGFETEYTSYQINLFTGRGNYYYLKRDPVTRLAIESDHRNINFYENKLTEIPAGLYMVLDSGCLQFNGDGTGTVLYDCLAGDTKLAGTDHAPFTYTIGDDSRITLEFPLVAVTGTLMEGDLENELMISLDQESYYHLINDYGFAKLRLITNDPDVIAGLHSSEELNTLGRAYITAAMGSALNQFDVCCFGSFDSFLYGAGDEFKPPKGFSSDCIVVVEGWQNSDDRMFFGGCYRLYVDPFSLKGVDCFGNPVDLNNPPQLPENAYSFEEIENMVLTDYTAKTGRTPESVSSYLLEDGTAYVLIESQSEGVMDVYTIDTVTGKGTNQEGETVDLPQTGSNDPASYRFALLALLMMTAGLACCCTGMRRRETAER